MPRVEVITEVSGHDPEVLLDEHVSPDVLADSYYADQLVERIGWALNDAETKEQTAQH
jgi:hypothetical protein